MATITPIPNLLEARALELVAAWSDFDVAEQSAKEIIRRFQANEPVTVHLPSHPLFLSLQTACVIAYTRPFANGLELISPDYGTYFNSEWQQLHEQLFVWRTYLTGSSIERRFIVAREGGSKESPERLLIVEAGAVLEPARELAALRDMCADRKAMLWPAIEEVVARYYPVLDKPILLNLTESGRRV